MKKKIDGARMDKKRKEYFEIKLKELEYPSNHCYEPDTFKPIGLTQKRLELLKKNIPELMEGGDSLLDIGCNKGFICFQLRNKYKEIVGYEPSKPYHDFTNELKKEHNISNVTFYNGDMRAVPFDKKYDTVFVGNCHHYMFADAIKYNVFPFLFLKKLAGICKNNLIIDGPFEMKDWAVNKLSEEGKWPDSIKSLYNLENHKRWLAPQFELKQISENGCNRHTAIFTRINPDINYIENNDIISNLLQYGEVINCNPSRGEKSIFLHKYKRYKYDKGLDINIPDGVYLILNTLSEYFPVFHNIIVDSGKRVGDIAEYVDDNIVSDNAKLLRNILKMQNALISMGLIELDIRPSDFKEHNESIVNVDIDLIRHIGLLDPDVIYEKEGWWTFLVNTFRTLGLNEIKIHHIIDRIKLPDVFFKSICSL